MELGEVSATHGSSDPPAPWVAFVSASPRWFAPPITTVPAEGPSAECFDRSLPRHPPEGGPGACLSPRSDRSRVPPFRCDVGGIVPQTFLYARSVSGHSGRGILLR